MNPIRKYNWPLILIVFSMLLLSLFLGFWLKGIYSDQVAAFQKESSFLLSDAMHEWSTNSFQKIIQQSISGLPDSSIQANPKLNLQTAYETVINISNKKNEISTDSVINILIGQKNNNNKNTDTSKLQSNIIITNSDNHFTNKDSTTAIINDEGDLMIFVRQIFKGAALEKGLPNEFQIIHIESDSTLSNNTLVSKAYKDFLTGEKYAVAFKKNRIYILKKMLPEILFSLFLFSCFAFAFWMIYKNMQKQKRLNLLKNDFVNNITHELKTPITTVGVAMEALSNFDVLSNPQKTNEYLNIAKQELKRLSNLVDSVLSMSLYEQTAPELNFEKIDFKKLVSEIANSMNLQFEKHHAKLFFHANDNNYFLKGDKTHLTNVIYNLLDNALKYSKENPIINIELNSNENELLLKIKDNGIGIPDVYKNKIFDKFFRVPTGDQHNVKGYGLGLNYVANVIRQHGGHINVETTQGLGTSFTIQLPIR